MVFRGFLLLLGGMPVYVRMKWQTAAGPDPMTDVETELIDLSESQPSPFRVPVSTN